MIPLGAVISVILTILKIIGIILLVILGLVLFLLAVILFAPVRYYVAVDYHGKLVAKGKITWLLHVLSVPFWWREGKLDGKIKILGISVTGLLEKRNKKKKSKKPKVKKKKAKKGKQANSVEEKPKEEEVKEADKNQNKVERIEKQEESFQQTVSEEQPEQNQYETDEKQQKQLLIFRIFDRIKEKLGNIGDAIKKVCGALKSGGEKASKVKEFLACEEAKLGWGFLMENLRFLWRHSKPKKLKGNLYFGTNDPCSTGEMLAALSILYAWYGPAISIVPNFEEEVLECDLEIKGKVRGITAAILVKRVLLDEDFKKFRKKAGQFKEDL